MASLIKRTWYGRGPTGHKVKHVGYDYTLQVHGKQERKTDADWTKAQAALAARLLERDVPMAAASPKTFGEVATEYLEYKRGKGKRSIRQDEQLVDKLKARLGAGTLLAEITAQRIAQYDRQRVTETSRLGRPVTPSTVKRELAVLRHLLGLAEEWGYLGKVPRIRLAREPEGRLRFLAEEEVDPTAPRRVRRAGHEEPGPAPGRDHGAPHGHAQGRDPGAHLGARRLRPRRPAPRAHQERAPAGDPDEPGRL